ncbi:hypothetical protein BJV78DRAFT_193341 [Lactifluus subvellereus]|nr:hypothetical protein BJV78DRAFT_193341 [Lactifluus subvellereus]
MMRLQMPDKLLTRPGVHGGLLFHHMPRFLRVSWPLASRSRGERGARSGTGGRGLDGDGDGDGDGGRGNLKYSKEQVSLSSQRQGSHTRPGTVYRSRSSITPGVRGRNKWTRHRRFLSNRLAHRSIALFPCICLQYSIYPHFLSIRPSHQLQHSSCE